MIWKDFKSNIINLGFEEQDIFEESEKHLIESCNRGIIFLNSYLERKNKIKKKDIPETNDYYMVDISEFEDFDSVSGVPPKIKGKPVSDFYYEDDILYIKAPGTTVTITYNSKSELIPYDVEENYVIPVKQELLPLLEHITAYYVWLDDDERKAVYYYNQYQEFADKYLSLKNSEIQNGVTAMVEGGIDI